MDPIYLTICDYLYNYDKTCDKKKEDPETKKARDRQYQKDKRAAAKTTKVAKDRLKHIANLSRDVRAQLISTSQEAGELEQHPNALAALAIDEESRKEFLEQVINRSHASSSPTQIICDHIFGIGACNVFGTGGENIFRA